MRDQPVALALHSAWRMLRRARQRPPLPSSLTQDPSSCEQFPSGTGLNRRSRSAHHAIANSVRVLIPSWARWTSRDGN